MTLQRQSIIEQLYSELKEIGVVNTTDDFSVNWLGTNRTYLRCIRAKRKAPSAKVMAHCAIELRKASAKLQISDKPKVANVAKRLDGLAQLCVNEIFAEHI